MIIAMQLQTICMVDLIFGPLTNPLGTSSGNVQFGLKLIILAFSILRNSESVVIEKKGQECTDDQTLRGNRYVAQAAEMNGGLLLICSELERWSEL